MNKQVTLTDRQIEALQNVVDYSIDSEYADCEMHMTENEEEGLPEDVEDGDHIYYDLRIISELLNEIK